MKLVPSTALYLQDLIRSYGLRAVLAAVQRLPGHNSVYITQKGALVFLDGRDTIDMSASQVATVVDYLVKTEFALDAVTIHHVALAQSGN